MNKRDGGRVFPMGALTVRDAFAMAAVTGWMAGAGRQVTYEFVAEKCGKIADAMMAEREASRG